MLFNQTSVARLSQIRVADFLLRHPEHRHILAAVQIVPAPPYAKYRDNTSAPISSIDLFAPTVVFRACHLTRARIVG